MMRAPADRRAYVATMDSEGVPGSTVWAGFSHDGDSGPGLVRRLLNELLLPQVAATYYVAFPEGSLLMLTRVVVEPPSGPMTVRYG